MMVWEVAVLDVISGGTLHCCHELSFPAVRGGVLQLWLARLQSQMASTVRPD